MSDSALAEPVVAAPDRLAALLEHFRVRTKLFHTGPLCGVTTFAAQPGRGFLHVLREGEMEVTHQEPDGRMRRTVVDRPSLVFYPRPLEHAFHNAPTDDSDFACAVVDFEGGATHPLVRTLPSLVVLPLDAVGTLAPALELLFAEVDDVGCGSRLVADRLFEVVLIRLLRWILDNSGEMALPPGLLLGLGDERLTATLVALHENPGAPWTLEQMARTAGLSRSAFAERFRATVGQPPNDYLIEWRLTLAQQRLRAGSTVQSVALELGYASVSAFSRVFSQRLGCSPRQWLAGVAAA